MIIFFHWSGEYEKKMRKEEILMLKHSYSRTLGRQFKEEVPSAMTFFCIFLDPQKLIAVSLKGFTSRQYVSVFIFPGSFPASRSIFHRRRMPSGWRAL
jgi:hypothetical protein